MISNACSAFANRRSRIYSTIALCRLRVLRVSPYVNGPRGRSGGRRNHTHNGVKQICNSGFTRKIDAGAAAAGAINSSDALWLRPNPVRNMLHRRMPNASRRFICGVSGPRTHTSASAWIVITRDVALLSVFGKLDVHWTFCNFRRLDGGRRNRFRGSFSKDQSEFCGFVALRSSKGVDWSIGVDFWFKMDFVIGGVIWNSKKQQTKSDNLFDSSFFWVNLKILQLYLLISVEIIVKMNFYFTYVRFDSINGLTLWIMVFHKVRS